MTHQSYVFVAWFRVQLGKTVQVVKAIVEQMVDTG